MTPNEFERRHHQVWSELEQVLARLEAPKKKGAVLPGDLARLPALYRAVCHHLALATDRQYPHFLLARLHTLVEQAHQAMYQSKGRLLSGVWRYFAIEFPSLVRDNGWLLLISALLFCVPLFGLLIACLFYPEAVYSVFDPGQVANFEQMYNPAARVIGRERAADTDFLMFGVYIRNNIGISFQVFASGLLAGLGCVVYLVANGLFIGAIAGYLTAIDYGSTFWQFVCGHGAFELTAIVLSGVAGLKLGLAVVSPGQLTRREALVAAGRVAVRLMYGVTAMLVIAAFIEAFWSSARWVAPAVKYAAAAMLWSAVFYYFVFQGRARATDAGRAAENSGGAA